MAYEQHSPRVVGTRFFAKYGYDDSLTRVSMNLTSSQDEVFWKRVLDVLDELRADELRGVPS
ncbi:hypothetical protein MTBPR1_40243 [Candidatus Terasakiella magnetica]|uniref:Uncharacterized protein n=1 Tax=Candidatus Terasakiella magnetica TaxID=1867952 RepID=A0A1C3RIY2_9PROT|nr:hypothetical protein [Candidatus Terasakiella magnetica]SCA57220.1 hypothetical protein MTBPR1_40243 [Candidatus Terasakiella magnetica]